MAVNGIFLLDNTLRESEQVPGVVFGSEARRRIALKLEAAGVHMLDIGLPGNRNEWLAHAEMNTSLTSATAGVSIRSNENELRMAADYGFKHVFAMFPCSELHISQKLGLRKEEVLSRIDAFLRVAATLGCKVHMVAEDASRGSRDLLKDFCERASAGGAATVFLCDTVGVLTPNKVDGWIETARTASGTTPVGVHCHNDFGMATANTVTAAHAGATWLSVTMNGLGERAGNADLVQVVAALEYLLEQSPGIDLPMLVDLARQIEIDSGIPLPVQAPLTGWTAFRHESGIHVDGVLKSPRIYEPVEPEDLGRKRNFVLGRTSGRAHIRALLAKMGIDPAAVDVDALFTAIRVQPRSDPAKSRQLLDTYYGYLSGLEIDEQEFAELLSRLTNGAPADT